MIDANTQESEVKTFLGKQLGNDPDSLARINNYYYPVYSWLNGVLAKKAAGALIVGINGQQGCGKSTLCHYLCELFELAGKNVISISVDDFYLTNRQQRELAQKNSSNPYLQPRGYPGTHDIELGAKILSQAQFLREGEWLALPAYDKSAFAGQGNRAPKSQWSEVNGLVDLILFEGWMLGFTHDPALECDDPGMPQINDILKKYDAWNSSLDAFIHLDSDHIENVVSWRIESEENMKAEGKSGMSQKEIEAYVRLFLPCYEIYLPRLRDHPPVVDPRISLVLGRDRLPVNGKLS